MWENYQVRVDEEDSRELQKGVAKGRYDTDIRIYAGAPFLEDDRAPEGRRFITPGRGDEEVAHTCAAGVIT